MENTQPQPITPLVPKSKFLTPLLVALGVVAVAAAAYFVFVRPVGEVAQSPSPAQCTQEAKLCPDGTAVGRTGPSCEFAECPDVSGISKLAHLPDFILAESHQEPGFQAFDFSRLTVHDGEVVKTTLFSSADYPETHGRNISYLGFFGKDILFLDNGSLHDSTKKILKYDPSQKTLESWITLGCSLSNSVISPDGLSLVYSEVSSCEWNEVRANAIKVLSLNDPTPKTILTETKKPPAKGESISPLTVVVGWMTKDSIVLNDEQIGYGGSPAGSTPRAVNVHDGSTFTFPRAPWSYQDSNNQVIVTSPDLSRVANGEGIRDYTVPESKMSGALVLYELNANRRSVLKQSMREIYRPLGWLNESELVFWTSGFDEDLYGSLNDPDPVLARISVFNLANGAERVVKFFPSARTYFHPIFSKDGLVYYGKTDVVSGTRTPEGGYSSNTVWKQGFYGVDVRTGEEKLIIDFPQRKILDYFYVGIVLAN